jgi:hypothetical protein
MDDIWMSKAGGAADGGLGAGAVRSAILPPAQRRSGSAPDGAVPLRLVQVYLTPVIDEFLRQARSMAIMQGFDVSASAVVRHAMERLMANVSAAEMVELLGSPKGRSQRKRGRPRR